MSTAIEKAAAIRARLAGGVRVVCAPQLFPTPPELAARLCDLAHVQSARSVLEPSAGTGNLIRAALATGTEARIHAVEINWNLVEMLRREFIALANSSRFYCEHVDFLALDCFGLGLFDAIVMNPPFENGSDIKHIQYARNLLQIGGTLAAICANGPRQRAALFDDADYWEDLPAGTFQASGTNVNTALVVFKR